MRRLSLCILLAITAILPLAAASSSVSMPSFWRYAHPESKAVIGIEWNRILNSPIGAQLREKVFESGAEGEEALAVMDQIQRIFITSPGNPAGAGAGQPPMVAAAQGTFDLTEIRELLRKEGADSSTYESIEIYEHFDEKGEATSVALIDERLVLAGDPASIQAAIDHYYAADASQMSNPLFQRAIEVSLGNDIWLVANASPEDFGGGGGGQQAEFLKNVERLEAGISLQSGLGVNLNLGTASAQSATELAAGLQMIIGMMMSSQQQDPNMPNFAEKLRIWPEQDLVRMAFQLDEVELEQSFGQLAASLPGSFSGGEAAVEGGSMEMASAEAPAAQGGYPAWDQTPARAPEPEPTGPRVITIWGLEEGPKEIKLNDE